MNEAPATRSLFTRLRRIVRSRLLAFYALAYAGGAALQKGIGFLLFLWLARVLPVEKYAYFGMLFALQSGVAQLAGAGIVESVIGLRRTHVSLAQRLKLLDAANDVFLMMVVPTLIAAVLLYCLLAPAESADNGAELMFVLTGGVLTAFFALQATLARLDEHHLSSLALTIGAPLAGLAVAFIAFLFKASVAIFYTGMAIGLFVALLVLCSLHIGHYGLTLRWAQTANVRAGLGPYLAVTFLSWLGGYGNVYLVKIFFDTTDIAIFTFLYTLSSVMQLVATSTNQVWSPRIFRLAHEIPLEELEQRSRRFYMFQGVILGAVGAVMLLAVPTLLDFLGGNLHTYRDLTSELSLLLAGYVATIPWWHTQNYYMAHGEGRALMNVVLVTSLLGLVALLGLMVLLGPIGIYAGFLAQMSIRSLGSLYWARRQWDLHLAWQGPLIALSLLTMAVCVAHMLSATTF